MELDRPTREECEISSKSDRLFLRHSMNRLTAQILLQVLSVGLACSEHGLSEQNLFPELLNIRRTIGRGAYYQALDQSLSLLDLRPGTVSLYDLIVEAAHYSSRLVEVDSLLRRRVDEGKDVSHALYARGQLSLKGGRWTNALQMFESSSHFGLDAASLHGAQEYAYEKAYGIEKAVDHYLALSHREPHNAGVWYSLALAYWSLPDPENAISAIAQALTIAPDEPRFRQLRAGVICCWSLTEKARDLAIREVKNALATGDVDGAEFVRWCVIDALYTVGARDSAMSMVGQAYLSVCEFGQLKWRAHLHLALARSHFSLGLTLLALQHADSASKYFSVVDDIDGCVSSRALKIGILRESGAVQCALQNCFRMLSELSSNSDARLWGGAFIDASLTLSEIGAFQIALAMGIEAQRILQKCSYAVYDQIRMNTALGLVHQRSGNIDLALRYQRIALELSEHASVARNSIATCEGKLAVSLLLQGDTLQALGHLKRQLFLAREMKDPGEEKEALLVLGEIDAARRRYDAAKMKLHSSFEIAKSQNDDRTMQKCYLALGRVAEREGDMDKAKAHYACLWRALRVQRRHRYHMLLTEQTRDRYLNQHGNLVHALCRAGQPADAFALIEVVRRDASFELFCHSSRSKSEKAANRLVKQCDLRSLLAEKRRGIGKLLESQDILWSQLVPLIGEFLAIADTLARAQQVEPPIEAQPNHQNVDSDVLPYVKDHILNKEDILLEYWVGESVIERFAVTSDTFAHKSLPMDKRDLNSLVNRALEISDDPSAGNVEESPSPSPSPAGALNRLSEVLLKGLDDLLSIKQRVRVVGDEPIIDMTFDVLTLGIPEKRVQLVTQHSISYASTVFLFDSTYLPASSAPFGVLILADPLGPVRRSEAATLVSRVKSGMRHEVYRLDLPTAQREAEAIRLLFGPDCEVRTGGSANKKSLITASHSFRILHIAAHSTARERLGEIHAIFLSPDAESEGILTYNEIAGLDLDCDLVVISGCDAGRPSKIRDWRSLARAFIEAGAASVVAADWKVEDAMTDKLFSRFYWHVRRGESIGRALQMAKVSMIGEGFRDARLWAGFRLYGRDGSVAASTNEANACHTPWNASLLIGLLLIMVAVVILGHRATLVRRNVTSLESSHFRKRL